MKVCVILRKKWNHGECRRECKELDDWGSYENGMVLCRILARAIMNVIKHRKLVSI